MVVENLKLLRKESEEASIELDFSIEEVVTLDEQTVVFDDLTEKKNWNFWLKKWINGTIQLQAYILLLNPLSIKSNFRN